MLNSEFKYTAVEPVTAKLRPEAELLLCCARLVLTTDKRERILQVLANGLDWVWLLELASEHGLRALLYRHLSAIAPAAVPKPIFVELWGHYELSSRRNQAMAQELLRILRILDSKGIPAIPYKGPALAMSVYRDFALREFGDLDILLKPQDVLPAKDLLQEQGYHPMYPLKPAVETTFLNSPRQYHLVLVHDLSAVMVELHWMTDPDYPVESNADDRWWANLGIADFGEDKIRCFSPEELLLILCVHSTKHYWARLGWLVDIAELIRQHSQMNWEWIMTSAQTLGCERRLAISLHLTHKLLGAPLPEKVQCKITHDRTVKYLGTKIAGVLFTPALNEMGSFQRLSLDLKMHDRTRKKLDHCVNVIFAPTLAEWSQWSLPRDLHFLYLPLRVIRLIKKYWLTLLR